MSEAYVVDKNLGLRVEGGSRRTSRLAACQRS